MSDEIKPIHRQHLSANSKVLMMADIGALITHLRISYVTAIISLGNSLHKNEFFS